MRRRPGGDQTRNVWLQSSCGESHVAADQLQLSLGSSSSTGSHCSQQHLRPGRSINCQPGKDSSFSSSSSPHWQPGPVPKTNQSSQEAEGSLSHRDMDVAAFAQLDGAHATPPLSSMPPEPLTPEAAPRPTVDRAAPPPSDTPPSPACGVIPQLDGAEEVPTTTTPPPPPPLPPPCGVLCHFCENVKHSDLFFMCAGCHWESHNEPYLDCPDCEELRLESIHQVSHNAPLFDCPECKNIRSTTTKDLS